VIAAEPTVPKLIVLPVTVPFRLSVFAGAESVMLPLSFDPDSCHVSWKVPE
jgi:hypothetical protein